MEEFGPYATYQAAVDAKARIRGELDPLAAAEWGRVYTEVGPEYWPALYAWVESGDYIAEGNTDLPSIFEFEERYCGAWENFREYAENLADVRPCDTSRHPRRRSPAPPGRG